MLAFENARAGLRVVDPLSELHTTELACTTGGVERTEVGAIMLPDASGFGPLYMAGLRLENALLPAYLHNKIQRFYTECSYSCICIKLTVDSHHVVRL